MPAGRLVPLREFEERELELRGLEACEPAACELSLRCLDELAARRGDGLVLAGRTRERTPAARHSPATARDGSRSHRAIVRYPG